MLPSSKSERKIVSSDRQVANKALIQIIPGIISFTIVDFVPKLKGKSVMTIIKKINELIKSVLSRKASIRSRFKITLKIFIYSDIIISQMNTL